MPYGRRERTTGSYLRGSAARNAEPFTWDGSYPRKTTLTGTRSVSRGWPPGSRCLNRGALALPTAAPPRLTTAPRTAATIRALFVLMCSSPYTSFAVTLPSRQWSVNTHGMSAAREPDRRVDLPAVGPAQYGHVGGAALVRAHAVRGAHLEWQVRGDPMRGEQRSALLGGRCAAPVPPRHVRRGGYRRFRPHVRIHPVEARFAVGRDHVPVHR